MTLCGRLGWACALTGWLILSCGAAGAVVSIEWVVVGDAGNVGEVVGEGAGGLGPDRICGAVDHEYRIAKFEVTNGQYIEFLNAVAVIGDPHQLFEAEDPGGYGGMDGAYGGIQRFGSPGSYWYRAKNNNPLWLTKPVHFISYYDALRFANWLHNRQPTGAQDAATTEDGAYDLSLGASVARKPGARVFLPDEDEWYKAAYYKGGGPDAGYWDYPTCSDTPPVGEPPPGGAEPPGSANYVFEGLLVVGPPFYAVDVGAYTLSPSPYGTFNQADNVHEWIEDAMGTGRGLHGGGWPSTDPGYAPIRIFGYPPEGTIYLHTGFRLASGIASVGVEPSTEPPVHRAAWVENRVEIAWTRTPAASAAATFAVFRLDAGRGVRSRIADPEIVASESEYVLRDRAAATATTYTYEVFATESGTVAPLFSATITTPALDFALHQNEPNPFNPSTRIRFTIPRADRMRLAVYDASGRRVRVLLDETRGAGEHAATWDGRDDAGRRVGSGAYVCRLETTGRTQARRLLLLK